MMLNFTRFSLKKSAILQLVSCSFIKVHVTVCNTGSHLRCGQQWPWESNRSSWRTVQNGLFNCLYIFL